MKRIARISLLACFVLVSAAGCAGTMTHKYGSLQADSAVAQAFAAGDLKPNLTYYYLSSEDTPYVIIGVDKNLVLDDAEAWRLMVPQLSTNLQRIVRLSYDRWRAQGYVFAGFRMLDQGGRHIGDWYSIWDINIINPVIHSREDNHVVIYPPPFPRLEPSPPDRIDRR